MSIFTDFTPIELSIILSRIGFTSLVCLAQLLTRSFEYICYINILYRSTSCPLEVLFSLFDPILGTHFAMPVFDESTVFSQQEWSNR